MKNQSNLTLVILVTKLVCLLVSTIYTQVVKSTFWFLNQLNSKIAVVSLSDFVWLLIIQNSAIGNCHQKRLLSAFCSKP